MAMFSSKEEKLKFKQQLKASMVSLLEARIDHSIEAIRQAQDSANSESKSAMGDKYETSRAMGQLDAEMNAKQLKEAQTELSALKQMNVETLYTVAVPGSVVCMGELILFTAAGLGTVNVMGKTVITLSVRSPLFMQLKQKAVGESILFQNKEQKITSIF